MSRDKIDSLSEVIQKLRIIKGKLSTDPTIYEFEVKIKKITGDRELKVIRVCAEKMDSSREFRKQYQKVSYLPAERLKNEEWDSLLWDLDTKKITVEEAPEESDSVFKINEIFSKICDFLITTSIDEVGAGNGLYDFEGLYWLPSWKIKDIVDMYNYRIPFNILSAGMTELKYKAKGTRLLRFNKKQVRCWGFIPSEVMKVNDGDR
jgi:hypothetical protein